MGLVILAAVISLIVGLRLGIGFARAKERLLLKAELDTGEVELDGWHYWVQAIEFPDRQRRNEGFTTWRVTMREEVNDGITDGFSTRPRVSARAAVVAGSSVPAPDPGRSGSAG